MHYASMNQYSNYYYANYRPAFRPQYPSPLSYLPPRQPVPVYYNPPVAYNPPPYVTLSQVPYTGLDLGPFGTVIYWSFLILMSLVGAYLIVVKRAHRTLAKSMHSFLFGSNDEEEDEQESVEATPALSTIEVKSSPATRSEVYDPIDEFVLTQIRRA